MALTGDTPITVTNGCNTYRGILNLPSEVLERIFWSMDESTFFISLYVCRKFLEAGSTRKNLRLQVRRLPGLHAELEYLRGIVFRTECQKVASTSGCTASILADIAKTAFPDGTLISRSVISRHPSALWYQGALATDIYMALANEDGTIKIYSLADRDVRHVLILALDTFDAWNRPTKIARLAFSAEGDLLVLYERDEQVREGQLEVELPYSESESVVEGAPQIRNVYELSIFCGCFGHRPDRQCCNRKYRRYQIFAPEGAKPMSLAFGCSGVVSIAWGITNTKVSGLHCSIQLVLPTESIDEGSAEASNTESDPSNIKYNRFKSMASNPFTGVLDTCDTIVQTSFLESEEKLLVQDSRMPVHSSYRYYASRAPQTFHGNSSNIHNKLRPKNSAPFKIGVPFHVSCTRTSRRSCIHSYLALGVPGAGFWGCSRKDHEEHLYIAQYDEMNRRRDCDHALDLQRDASAADWKIVALLAGWRRNRGTMGSLIEYTPGVNRIASAVWNRILVWTFQPKALHPDTVADYFPPRDYNAHKGFGRLRPIMLPPRGVVHALKWTSNDTLYALTDTGLVRWYIGPHASAKREVDPPGSRGP